VFRQPGKNFAHTRRRWLSALAAPQQSQADSGLGGEQTEQFQVIKLVTGLARPGAVAVKHFKHADALPVCDQRGSHDAGGNIAGGTRGVAGEPVGVGQVVGYDGLATRRDPAGYAGVRPEALADQALLALARYRREDQLTGVGAHHKDRRCRRPVHMPCYRDKRLQQPALIFTGLFGEFT
jgi:hypothetical protein